jgi:pre-mRNA-processing factor 19
VRIWDVKSRAEVAALEGHQGAISCLAFSENGYYMATGAADATVKLWDLRKTKNFHTITPAAGGAIGGVQFDYSGQFLTVGSNDVR